MMQNCPKCGFSQPKDKYCANCGLDIEAYKPAPEPLLTRLKKNTWLQIGVVVAVVFGLTVAVFIVQRERIVSHLAGAEPTKKRAMPVYDNNPAKPMALNSSARNDAPITAPAAAAMAPTTTHALNPGAAAEGHKYKTLNIQFFEISKPALMQLAGEGQVLNETPNTKSFLLNAADAAAKIREIDAEAHNHGDSRTENFEVNTPFNLDFTHISGKKTGENVGMSVTFTPTAMTDALWDFSVEANINLKNETGGSLLSTTVNGSYSMPPKAILFLAGFLPHQKIANEDLWSFSNSPLQIYSSDKFINGLTEFVIVIQPK